MARAGLHQGQGKCLHQPLALLSHAVVQTDPQSLHDEGTVHQPSLNKLDKLQLVGMFAPGNSTRFQHSFCSVNSRSCTLRSGTIVSGTIGSGTVGSGTVGSGPVGSYFTHMASLSAC